MTNGPIPGKTPRAVAVADPRTLPALQPPVTPLPDLRGDYWPMPANKYTVQIARLALKAQKQETIKVLVDRGADVAGQVLKHPVTMIIAGCTLTNMLSQWETGTYNGAPIYALPGPLAVTIETLIATVGTLTTLTEVAKPAIEIAELVKMFGV